MSSPQGPELRPTNFSQTVLGVLSDLRVVGPVTPPQIVKAIFRRHPEYAGSRAGAVDIGDGSVTLEATLWAAQVQGLFPPDTLVDGRLFVLGLCEIDPFTLAELERLGVLASLYFEARSEITASSLPKVAAAAARRALPAESDGSDEAAPNEVTQATQSSDTQPAASAPEDDSGQPRPLPEIEEMHPDWPNNLPIAEFIYEVGSGIPREIQNRLIHLVDIGELSRVEALEAIAGYRKDGPDGFDAVLAALNDSEAEAPPPAIVRELSESSAPPPAAAETSTTPAESTQPAQTAPDTPAEIGSNVGARDEGAVTEAPASEAAADTGGVGAQEPTTLAHLLAQPFAARANELTRNNLRYAGEIGRPTRRPIDSLLFIVATINRASKYDRKDTGWFFMKALQGRRDSGQDKNAVPNLIVLDLLDDYGVEDFDEYKGVDRLETFEVEPECYEVLRVASELSSDAGAPGLSPRHVIGAILSPVTPKTVALSRLERMGFDVPRLRSELIEFIGREHHDEVETWRKYLAEEAARMPDPRPPPDPLKENGATAAAKKETGAETAAAAGTITEAETPKDAETTIEAEAKAGETKTAETKAAGTETKTAETTKAEAEAAPSGLASDASHSVSDQPTTDDALGFGPYVGALAEFLTDAETEPPLTVSVEGDWGSGKSSFMLQLEKTLHAAATNERRTKLFAYHLRGLLTTRFRRFPRWLRNRFEWGGWRILYVPDWARGDLRRTRRLVVRFNAWRHDKEDALWASFALEFVTQLSRQLTPAERWRARAKLLSRRSGWPARLAMLRAAALLLLLVSLTGALVSIAAAGGFSHFLNYVSEGGALDPGKVFRLLAEGSGVAGYVAFLLFVIHKLRDYIGDPLALSIQQHLETPDYKGRVSFIESFHADFNNIVETYAGREKIYVFVDDLDRTEVPKAADLMQALNLLIAESQNLIFIIGMDREKVAAGLAVKYEKLLPYLASAATLAEGDGKGGARPAPTPDGQPAAKTPTASDSADGLEYGYTFIEKFIQIPFRVPQPGEPELRKMLAGLSRKRGKDGEEQPDEPARTKAVVKVEPGQSPPDARTAAVDGSDREAMRRIPAVRDIIVGRPTSAAQAPGGGSVPAAPGAADEQAAKAAEAAREASARFKSGASGDSERVKAIALMVAPALDNNPRRIKQFLNLFRLRAYIAANTQVDRAFTYEQLGKFVAISLRWPRLVADFEDNASLLADLEKAALQENAVGTVADYLKRRPVMIRLLKHGCVEGKEPYSPAKYSLANVDVGKLLIVAAPPPAPAATGAAAASPASNAPPPPTGGAT